MKLFNKFLFILSLCIFLIGCSNADAVDRKRADYCKKQLKSTKELIDINEMIYSKTQREDTKEVTQKILDKLYLIAINYGEAERAFRKGNTEAGLKYMNLAMEHDKDFKDNYYDITCLQMEYIEEEGLLPKK